MPGQPHVTSGFLPQGSRPDFRLADAQRQQYGSLAAAHGMKGPKTGETIPAKTNRR
jgi:hypothetical protein